MKVINWASFILTEDELGTLRNELADCAEKWAHSAYETHNIQQEICFSEAANSCTKLQIIFQQLHDVMLNYGIRKAKFSFSVTDLPEDTEK
jgi:hypothetical protein